MGSTGVLRAADGAAGGVEGMNLGVDVRGGGSFALAYLQELWKGWWAAGRWGT